MFVIEQVSAFAIQQISTGKFFPYIETKDGPKKTGVKPKDFKPVPRLFSRQHDAKRLLDMWLRGVMKSVVTTHSIDGEPPQEYPGYVFIPQPDRIPSDYHVVELEFTIKQENLL